MARVLVTGGAGFIGSNLVRGLLEQSDDVRVLDNFSTGNRANLEGLDVEIVEGELRSYERVHNAVRGTEVVYHLGAQAIVGTAMRDEHLRDREVLVARQREQHFAGPRSDACSRRHGFVLVAFA